MGIKRTIRTILVSPVRNTLVSRMPLSMKRGHAKRHARAMTEAIAELTVKEGSTAEIGGETFARILLENGIELIGAIANPDMKATFGWLAEEKGLSQCHAKILVDAVTRYVYPHMACGYMTMNGSINDRRYFHPQHKNLVGEDKSMDDTTKSVLEEMFKPKEGWRVIDIGAYLGHGAAKMAQLIGPEGKLICVEAKHQNYLVVQEHLRRNCFEQVQVFENAIWSEAGHTVDFHVTEYQANAIDAEVVDGQKVCVKTTSIQALCDKLGCAPNLVSLTVNGAEVEAIEGMRKMPPDRLPERILAPGWYMKDGEPRSKLIISSLERLGYQVACTEGGLVFAWRI